MAKSEVWTGEFDPLAPWRQCPDLTGEQAEAVARVVQCALYRGADVLTALQREFPGFQWGISYRRREVHFRRAIREERERRCGDCGGDFCRTCFGDAHRCIWCEEDRRAAKAEEG